MTDLELLHSIEMGDPQAGRLFVDRYQVQVYNVCFSFLRNTHDAEDLTQEVFIEVIRNATKFRGDSKLSTWLFRIATNRSLNYIRDNRKRRFWKEIDSFFSMTAEREPGSAEVEPGVSDDKLEQAEQNSLLTAAIGALPINQQTAFTLSRIDELSYAETAAVMDISLSAVESLIHRARLNLQKKLKSYYR